MSTPPLPPRRQMLLPNRVTRLCFWYALLLPVALPTGLTNAATDLSFESATLVNEGRPHFLEITPAKPVHHHQNDIVINGDSLDTGWASQSQFTSHHNHAMGEKIGIKLAVDHVVAFRRG